MADKKDMEVRQVYYDTEGKDPAPPLCDSSPDPRLVTLVRLLGRQAAREFLEQQTKK